MSSQIEIWNLALSKLGAQLVHAPSDDTRNANHLNAIWQATVDAELAAHPWAFAMARARLPASTTPPAFGFGAAYPLPTDFLKMVEVGRYWTFYQVVCGGPLFAIEGRSVLTDMGSPLDIRYVRRVANTGDFAPLFVQALACRLAAESAEALTQNESKRQMAWQERKQALTAAKISNDIEQPPQRGVPGSWEMAANGWAG